MATCANDSHKIIQDSELHFLPSRTKHAIITLRQYSRLTLRPDNLI